MAKLHKAVFPGTFDPATLGHFDIIKRASSLFDNLIIAVAKNPNKHTLLSHEDRVLMLQKTCEQFDNVKVLPFSCLLVDFLKENDANILVRGVRTVADYDYEIQLTGMYRTMMPKLDIVMLPTDKQLSYISSTLVRDVILHNGDISQFVPEQVNSYIKKLNLIK